MGRPSPAIRAGRNLLRAAACWARASEGGRTRESEGLFCTGSPVPVRSFNQAFVTAPLRDPGSLQEALSWYAQHRRFRVRAHAELEDSVRGAAQAAGLLRQGAMPCMGLERQLPERMSAVLRIEPVTDERTLTHHVRVVAEAFGWRTEDLARVFTPALLADGEWSAWVGYAGGEPVATAQLLVHEGVAGLYYLAVVESARGKGYGEAITCHAAAGGGARGCDLVTLQASPAGYPLYKRLGFEDIGEYVTYVPKE